MEMMEMRGKKKDKMKMYRYSISASASFASLFLNMCMITQVRRFRWYNIHGVHLVCEPSTQRQTHRIAYYCPGPASSQAGRK